MNIINSVKDIGLAGYLDIGFMAILIYAVIVGFKRTRAAFVLTGIFVIALIYLLTRQFNMVMTASVFEKFFADTLKAYSKKAEDVEEILKRLEAVESRGRNKKK